MTFIDFRLILKVSLFSEMFYEMLCRDYANVILSALESEKKRRRVDEEKEQVAKKVKVVNNIVIVVLF